MFLRTVLITMAFTGVAMAEQPTAESGQEIYASYCVQCHGANAQGDGPMAEMIAIDTPDLTILSADNEGMFPLENVIEKIDGRAPMLAHGGEMPLFGHLFATDKNVTLKLPDNATLKTRLTVASVAMYLQSIQKK